MPVYLEETDYTLIHIEKNGDWRDLARICKGYLSEKDHINLYSYFKNTIKTVLVEKNYIDKDYRDTYYNFYSKKFAYYPSDTIRLHFFTSVIPLDDIFELYRYNEQYVGFTVIRPTRINTIGRTIVNPKMTSITSGHVCLTEYKVHILGSELTVTGFPYISQDSDVTVCAHAACWMVFRYFSERYSEYAETLPFQVSQLTENLSYGRLVPSKGLYVTQIAEIFSKFGFYPVIYTRGQYDADFDRLLYYYIESGLPVVAGSQALKHAITILGHISDYSKKATSMNSVDYLDGWIVNDDNCLPYQKVLMPGMPQNGYCSRITVDKIDSFVVPLYEKIYFSAEYVDKLVSAVLSDNDFGITNLSNLLKGKNIVRRIFLTTSKSYKMQRKKQSLPFNFSYIYSQMNMPKFIWICELSTEELYPKGEIVGEIIFDATANHHDMLSFLSIHYPDFMVLNDRKSLTKDPKRFIKGELDATEILSYPMYKNNLKEI